MSSLKFTHGGKPYRLEDEQLIREAYSTQKTDFVERPLVQQEGRLGTGYILGKNFFYIHQLIKLAK